MALNEIVNTYYKELSEIELHILEFILKHDLDYVNLTINELSEKCNVSTTSIHRTVKKLGFSGFSEFKFFMINDINKKSQQTELKVSNYKEIMLDNIALTLDAINDKDLELFLSLIFNSTTRYSYGTGWKQSSQLQAFSNDLLKYNKPLIHVRALTDLRSTADRMKKGDLFIVSSLGGETEGVAEIIRYLTLKGIHTISFTSFGLNSISKASEVNFYYQDDNYDEEHLPWPAMTLKALQDYIVYRYMIYEQEHTVTDKQ